MNYQNIDTDLLRPASYAELKDIKVSELDRYVVQKMGLQEPVICYPNPASNEHESYLIYAGFKTWLIAQEAEFQFQQVPAIINEKSEVSIAKVYPTIESHHLQQSRDVIEEAKLLLQVLNGKPSLSIAALARQLGRKRSDLSNQLRLLKLPIEIQNWIKQGKLSIGAGRTLITLDNDASQTSLAREIINNKLSIRDIENRVREIKRSNTSRGTTPESLVKEKDANVKFLEQSLSQLLGSEVQLEEGRVVIDYNNDLDVLQGLLQKLGLVELDGI